MKRAVWREFVDDKEFNRRTRKRGATTEIDDNIDNKIIEKGKEEVQGRRGAQSAGKRRRRRRKPLGTFSGPRA